jgi:SAM-dependent methyltransferase
VIDTLSFVLSHLGKSTRVLEVGAGDGVLAAELARRGFRVTAVDRSFASVASATRAVDGVEWVEQDVLDHRGGPYEAILFTRSLHHIGELDRVLEVAKLMLAPGGVVVIEEFDLDAPDEATAAFYYGSDAPGALSRWYAEHEETPPLHPGRVMRAGVGQRFRIIAETRVPYLFRAMVDRPGALEDEERAIAAGRICAVGLRLVAG